MRAIVNKKRLILIDILRGVAVLNMILYHFLYDWVYIFGKEVSWFSIRKSFVWEQFICFTFILIAGICFRYSKKPWKNGLKLLGFACILTLVTLLAIPSEVVWFGVLHLLAFAMLITWFLMPLLKRLPSWLGIIIFLFIFIMIKMLPEGMLGIRGVMEFPVPRKLYQTPYLFWLGFPEAHFTSSDYFPVLPWLFLFITGFYIGEYWQKFSVYLESKKKPISEQKWYFFLDKSIGFVGRKSLFIYLLHQPIIYGILLLLRWCNMI